MIWFIIAYIILVFFANWLYMYLRRKDLKARMLHIKTKMKTYIYTLENVNEELNEITKYLD